MRYKCLAVVLTAALCATASGELLYDVDFSSPYHTAGQVCSTDNGPAVRHGPTSIQFGSPTVVSTIGELTEQPCKFARVSANRTDYDQVRFRLDDLPSFSRYTIDLDVEMDVVPDTTSGYYTLAIILDTPEVRRLDLYNSGVIRSWVPYGETQAIGTYSLGHAVHIAMDVDLAAQTWSIRLNNGPWTTTGFLTNSLTAMRISTDPGVVAAVDNIEVNGVPEPMTLAMMAMGAIVVRRRRGFTTD